jgi:2-polyprenyl-6-methoxyphenol hydroxylase-like FAD-dependent oxidoreductase
METTIFNSPANSSNVDCCIVGGGPGGAVLALLLARQGVRVMLLEAHQDFEREFRGDTVHPSTLEMLDDLGLYERLLELPHATFFDFPTHYPDGTVSANTPLPVGSRHPRIMDVPQARFIDMLVAEAQRYPNFGVQLGARAEELLQENGVIRGVRYRAADGWREVRAALVVGADGRFSKIRQLAGMQLVGKPEPFDVLWLRLPRSVDDPERAHGIYLGTDGYVAVMARGEDWQVGYLFARGDYQRVRAAGLDALRASIARRAPFLADRLDHLQSWKQTALLQVEVGRVERWCRPGLLLIGDAAHVMSPVGGVGINYAIQDAVVASNLIGPRLRAGTLQIQHLECVQHRRELPTRIMQGLQRKMRPQMIAPGQPPSRPPLAARLMRLPVVRDVPARLIAFGGLWPAKVAPLEPWRQRVLRHLGRSAESALEQIQRGLVQSWVGFPVWHDHDG